MGPSQEIGIPIPENTPHAVSVTLPTWEATVGYEEGEDWVVSQMNSGYPRFFIHSIIKELAKNIEHKYGREGEKCMIFPSYNVAKRCREFIRSKSEVKPGLVRILQLSTGSPKTEEDKSTMVEASIGVCFFPQSEQTLAKNYWQHSGEGISSRMGEYFLRELFQNDFTSNISLGRSAARAKQELQAHQIQQRSPSISTSIKSSTFATSDERENNTYIEQKYGRLLDLKFAGEAKTALRRRISGNVESSGESSNDTLSLDVEARRNALTADDVYLYPTGMASIFNAHQALLKVFPNKKSVCFGFPYVDTLNILKKFGPGVHFLGLGDDKSLDELEEQLNDGSIDIMALFCECPSNPLLKTPDLKRIRKLADKHKFAVVVDETVGNFLNIHVLHYADMVASSLTKVFSGDSNVMGGSLILNPKSPIYSELKHYFNEEYEDNFWVEDALHLERNSRDFASRSAKINKTALATVDLLMKSSLISKVYYPSVNDTKKYYDEIKTPNGGYGGLISFLFHDPADAVTFFNAVNLHKGPSLGTNFTLACPYAILAHYNELEEITKYDVDSHLIRISIGLENEDELIETLSKSLETAASSHK